jgi:Fe-S cluster assembly iron-binding protein IscA
VPIQVTEEAIDVLRRSLELGGVDPAAGGVRLRAARGLGGRLDVQVELADGPQRGEITVQASNVRLFVDPGVTEAIPDALVAVEPEHDLIVVRPAK